MSFKTSKKAMELPMNLVVIAAILLIALFVILAMFTNIFGKETGQIRNYINNLDDCDKDGVANMFDPCPCDYKVEECENKILVSCEEGKPVCEKPKTTTK